MSLAPLPDARSRHAFSDIWSAALGVDDLDNRECWNFHPYPQRTSSFESRCDWR